MPMCFIINLEDQEIIGEFYGQPRDIACKFRDSQRKSGKEVMIRDLGHEYEIVELKKTTAKSDKNKVVGSQWIASFLITPNKPHLEKIEKDEEVHSTSYVKPVLMFLGVLCLAALNYVVDVINRHNKF